MIKISHSQLNNSLSSTSLIAVVGEFGIFKFKILLPTLSTTKL